MNVVVLMLFDNDVLYFKELPCDGVYETVSVVHNLGNNVLRSLDKASLWHCHLGHVSNKCIGQI